MVKFLLFRSSIHHCQAVLTGRFASEVDIAVVDGFLDVEARLDEALSWLACVVVEAVGWLGGGVYWIRRQVRLA